MTYILCYETSADGVQRLPFVESQDAIAVAELLQEGPIVPNVDLDRLMPEGYEYFQGFFWNKVNRYAVIAYEVPEWLQEPTWEASK
tara:strand:- start:3832 stop:4089 length:258 start_codon:yes stop_codon:yes gene_type:complete